jgi:hypothetical protein
LWLLVVARVVLRQLLEQMAAVAVVLAVIAHQ